SYEWVMPEGTRARERPKLLRISSTPDGTALDLPQGVKASARAHLALTIGLSCAAALGLVIVPSLFESRLAVFAYFVASTVVLLLFFGERTTRVRQIADAVTGLPGRSAYERWIAHEIRHAVRCRTALALLIVDVDRLKEINDREGHAAGDGCLRL